MGDILTTITDLPVTDIVMRHRLRLVSRAGVDAIKASITELGAMKDRIHVRKMRDGTFVLLAGAHRLTAALELGWDSVPVVCWKCTDDFAQLMEIDDNLACAELTPLDTAVFLSARKRIYEKLHPETKRGVAGAKARHGATDTMSVASFSASTAEKLGVSDRHVRRMIMAGAALGPDEVGKLRAAPRPVALNDLMQIAQITNSAERYHVVDSLAEGKVKNAATARKVWKAEHSGLPRPEKDRVEEAFLNLMDRWERAPEAAQRRFVAEHRDSLLALMEDLDD
ncbi:chromosome partitioning protein ParB [Thalassococcus profundi]|uniref:Chromosome partitioning protein ParB n=1 Tax=Thalassococcus profundi TaxID=2282382 RepID=A0A369TPX6_9RHOB|nr:ParB N-terminal domain-containing protein [Thalassococcus profundi]RDD65016.1 chromosome partitioning protein ParB [Thalassococcus profundi]